MDNFSCYLENLSARYGRDKVFADFLNIVVCCLSMGKQEELYFKTIKRYSLKEMDVFVQAFASLVIEMDNNGEGLIDVLGDYFEEHFYNERLGQFFTPPSLCNLMASLVPAEGDTLDPCCGSGRIFLAQAKHNRNITFYGADISEICCKMTLINMCLNGLKCKISWMDSLRMDVFAEWAVVIHSITKAPFIIELDKETNVVENEVCEVVAAQPVNTILKTKYKKFTA